MFNYHKCTVCGNTKRRVKRCLKRQMSVVYKKAFDAKSRGRSVHNEYGNYGKKTGEITYNW